MSTNFFNFPFFYGRNSLFRGDEFFNGEQVTADKLSAWIKENKFSIDVLSSLVGNFYPSPDKAFNSSSNLRYLPRFINNLASVFGPFAFASGLTPDHQGEIEIVKPLENGELYVNLITPIEIGADPPVQWSEPGADTWEDGELVEDFSDLNADGKYFVDIGERVLKRYNGEAKDMKYVPDFVATSFLSEPIVVPNIAQIVRSVIEDTDNLVEVEFIETREDGYNEYILTLPEITHFVDFGQDQSKGDKLAFYPLSVTGIQPSEEVTAIRYKIPRMFRGIAENHYNGSTDEETFPFLEGSDEPDLTLPFGHVYLWNISSGSPVFVQASGDSFGISEILFQTVDNGAGGVNHNQLRVLIPNGQFLYDKEGNVIDGSNTTNSNTYVLSFVNSQSIAQALAKLEHYSRNIDGAYQWIDHRYVSNGFKALQTAPELDDDDYVSGTLNRGTDGGFLIPSDPVANPHPQYLPRTGFIEGSDPNNGDGAMIGDILLSSYDPEDENQGSIPSTDTGLPSRKIIFGGNGSGVFPYLNYDTIELGGGSSDQRVLSLANSKFYVDSHEVFLRESNTNLQPISISSEAAGSFSVSTFTTNKAKRALLGITNNSTESVFNIIHLGGLAGLNFKTLEGDLSIAPGGSGNLFQLVTKDASQNDSLVLKLTANSKDSKIYKQGSDSYGSGDGGALCFVGPNIRFQTSQSNAENDSIGVLLSNGTLNVASAINVNSSPDSPSATSISNIGLGSAIFASSSSKLVSINTGGGGEIKAIKLFLSDEDGDNTQTIILGGTDAVVAFGTASKQLTGDYWIDGGKIRYSNAPLSIIGKVDEVEGDLNDLSNKVDEVEGDLNDLSDYASDSHLSVLNSNAQTASKTRNSVVTFRIHNTYATDEGIHWETNGTSDGWILYKDATNMVDISDDNDITPPPGCSWNSVLSLSAVLSGARIPAYVSSSNIHLKGTLIEAVNKTVGSVGDPHQADLVVEFLSTSPVESWS